jgi:hypothetical protein
VLGKRAPNADAADDESMDVLAAILQVLAKQTEQTAEASVAIAALVTVLSEQMPQFGQAYERYHADYDRTSPARGEHGRVSKNSNASRA